MSSDKDTLIYRIRARARGDSANAAELATLADDMEAATKGFFGQPQTVEVKSFMATYARVRRRWCEISGEPLVPRSVTRTAVNIAKLFQPRRTA